MMSKSNELETFRKQWKQEIKIQNSTTPDPSQLGTESVVPHTTKRDNIDGVGTSYPGDGKNCNFGIFHPAFRESSQQYSCKVASCSKTKQKSEAQYYPFRIVGNLLDDSTSSKLEKDQIRAQLDIEEEGVSNHGSSSTGKTGGVGSDNNKRLRKDIGVENDSKFKKKRLKDVFTFRDKAEKETGGHFLDQFIADLDEINEIPFFETTLAREIAINIFQYLSVQDLCRCSQVSKSWRSLAEDELLWCGICHRKGYEESHKTVDRQDWKNIVREHVEKKRRLDLNWRNRTGEMSKLEHLQGGYLCAVTSYKDVVVAGYTNGQVKLWDLEEEEECVFSPSNTALVIDENEDMGTISNSVTHVVLSSTLVAAAYQQGNIDVWKKNAGRVPLLTTDIRRSNSHRDIGDVLLASETELMVVVSGPFINIYKTNRDEGLKLIEVVDMEKWVHSAKIYGDGIQRDPLVTIATENVVKLHKPGHSSSEMTEVHHHVLTLGYVSCIEVSPDTCHVAVGLDMAATSMGDNLLSQCDYPVKVYDVTENRLVTTLCGSTWKVSCINMADSPPGMLVTGCEDRKVRIYDLRTDQPVSTYTGHLQRVTTVQMDDWKLVSGGADGFVRVWDQRMTTKLWDWHNSSPVRHCHFSERRLIVGNVPTEKYQILDDCETHIPKRLRGSVSVQDFTTDQMTEGVPEVCLSTYDQPEAYNFNIRLAMPYDTI